MGRKDMEEVTRQANAVIKTMEDAGDEIESLRAENATLQQRIATLEEQLGDQDHMGATIANQANRIVELEGERYDLHSRLAAAVNAENSPVELVYCDESDGAHDGPGWYYCHDEYRDEGSVGAFRTLEDIVCEIQEPDAGLVVSEASTLKLAQWLDGAEERIAELESERDAALGNLQVVESELDATDTLLKAEQAKTEQLRQDAEKQRAENGTMKQRLALARMVVLNMEPYEDNDPTAPAQCSPETPCCERRDEYNGFGSDGPTIFTCPKKCPCHD